MTDSTNCLSRLDSQGRLVNAIVNEASTKKKGTSLYRGDIAVKFGRVTELEKKPPELKAEQVLMSADSQSISFMAVYLLSFETLAPLADVLGEMLTAEGKYFAFCNNIDLSEHYQVQLGKVNFYVLPIDESSVFNEMLELLKIDKNDLKKLSPSEKVEAVATAANKFKKTFPAISYQRGLGVRGPVRGPPAKRPD